MLRVLMCAFLALAATQVWTQHDLPPQKVILPAPVGGLVAIAGSPFASTDVPEKQDFDSTLVVIKDAGSRVIAHHVFDTRLVTKMVWSPDGRFLALCSVSAGGHSPWHMNSYFWSRSDRHFAPSITGLATSYQMSSLSAHRIH